MKIMQINIWGGRLARGLTRYIEREQPDIICMQEVLNADFEVPVPGRMYDIFRILKNASGLEHEYFSTRFTVDVSGKTAPYGNAILSRFSFVSTNTIQTENAVVEHMTSENEIKDINNLQLVTVEVDNTIWTIANHHGHHEFDPMGNENSVAAMERVAKALRGARGPLVFCGDLNVVPESPTMRVFDGWLDDLVAHSGAITTLARLNVDRDVVCDHILVNDAVTVRGFKVDTAIVSDHYPLIAEVETTK